MNKLTREEMFRRFEGALPEPTTELDYRDAFELLIAVILSAQATDKSVNLATAGLFEAAPTPEAMIGLGLEGIKSHVRTIGLFNAKSENILKTCRLLIDEHGGAVPETREALQALPGVGRKTANVILNTAFGQETMAVDTHIFRVSNRTGLAKGKTVRAVEDHSSAMVRTGSGVAAAASPDRAKPMAPGKAVAEPELAKAVPVHVMDSPSDQDLIECDTETRPLLVVGPS